MAAFDTRDGSVAGSSSRRLEVRTEADGTREQDLSALKEAFRDVFAELRGQLADYERWFETLDDHVRVLERERKRFSAIVNQTDAGFLLFDADSRVVWTNAHFNQQFSGSGAVEPLIEMLAEQRARQSRIGKAAASLKGAKARAELDGMAQTVDIEAQREMMKEFQG